MICPNCTRPLQGNAAFCPYCGVPLKNMTPPPAEEAPMFGAEPPAPADLGNDPGFMTAPIPKLRGAAGTPGACPRCGAQLDASTGKCTYCSAGFPLPQFADGRGVTEKKKKQEDDYEDGEKPKRRGLSAALIIIAALLVAALAIGALTWFGVLKNVPVVSPLVEKLRGETEAPDDDTEPAAQTVEIGEAIPASKVALPAATTPQEPTGNKTEPAGPEAKQTVTLTGYLQYEVHERYESYTVIALILDEETAVKPDNRETAVSVERVNVEGEDVRKFCGKHVTLTGVPYATDADGVTTVSVADSKLKLRPSDERVNNVFGGGVKAKIDMKVDKSKGYKLYVRATPDAAGAVLTMLEDGAGVTVLAAKNGWSLIDYGSKQGWVNTEMAGLSGLEVIVTEEPTTQKEPEPASEPRSEPATPVDTSGHVEPARVAASDEIEEDGEYSRGYLAKNASDGDPESAWMAPADGAWIELDFSSEKEIAGIKLLNGNGWDGMLDGRSVLRDPYTAYARVERFTLTFSDGKTLSFRAKDLKESDFGANIFIFEKPVRTAFVRLTVESVYGGKTYEDYLCLSAFEAF
ncbi:MAG: zinc ribbon domain-containing protein [Clostridia bacterium]|nr:zinc ribbon domain-containing protein [Clostridia bacterium]